jgi:hypothetical protein
MNWQTRSRDNEYAGNNRINSVAMQRVENATIEKEVVCYVVRIYPLLGNGCVFYRSAWRLYKWYRTESKNLADSAWRRVRIFPL